MILIKFQILSDNNLIINSLDKKRPFSIFSNKPLTR
jgi:hypothetical protein